MEKIFKKSLALILSAALCLTALVGCLTVSAAEGDTTKPVYSVGSAEGAAGAEVEVVASFSEISNVCAHHVIFNFPAGLEVKAVKNAAGEDYVKFDNSGDRFDYKLDVAEDGSTKVQFLDFVNWAAENLSTTDMSIHFTVKIAADAAANTVYPVTIAVQAADYAAENLLDVTLTNGKVTVKADTHEHTWDAGVMTTMPTTTSNGVVTYTCTECQETRTEDFVVEGTIENRTDAIYADVSGAKYNYACRFTKALFQSLGDKADKYGILLTRDGTTPVYGEGTAVTYGEESAPTTAANKSWQTYFEGMNLPQMGETLTFRPYLKFNFGSQLCYYYGATYSISFIEAIRSNADEQSTALVAIYDSMASASENNIACEGTVVTEGDANIVTRTDATYANLKGSKINYAVRFTKALFTSLSGAGVTDAKYGILLTRDGTTPAYGEGTSVTYGEESAPETAANKSWQTYFEGMNLAQMGQSINFRPYVRYTGTDGNAVYVYGATVKINFIDVARTLADTDAYAASIVAYYDAYIATK